MTILRRFLLVLLSPLIFIGFSVATLVWWLMEGELEVKSMWVAFKQAWDKK